MKRHNRLVTASSPYLLQHAHNPVDWYPWGQEAISQAQKEDKPLLLSIGYAACHWCHVMAHESFEDPSIAALMNQYFINIKVDRQEHPALDQVSITALQAMGLPVGWPLHVFLLPNQEPFYGGTYFLKEDWKQLLQSIARVFANNKSKLYDSASFFTKTIQSHEEHLLSRKQVLSSQLTLSLDELFEQVYQSLDTHYGGLPGAPKFLMPPIIAFLLFYYWHRRDPRACSQFEITLNRAAYGGIYDHIRGGFFRYTIDAAWHIPHFEKMLYDNAQLINVYAYAYSTKANDIYKNVLHQTIPFLEREMYDPQGTFYAALDADSQGKEGAFYAWTYEELAAILQEDMHFFSQHFEVTPQGNWQGGYNILYKKFPILDATIDGTQGQHLTQLQQRLYEKSTQRLRPDADKQLIASWNGLTILGLVAAYQVMEEAHWLDLACKVGHFIKTHLVQKGRLWHSYSDGRLGQPGYLEDYAWVSRAFIALYQATLDRHWLVESKQLIDYVLANFERSDSQLYHFVSRNQHSLIKNPQEFFDQVIPSSNAALAHALFELGYLCYQPSYHQLVDDLLKTILPLLEKEAVYMTHWAELYGKKLQGGILVTVVGTNPLAWAHLIKRAYPYVLVNHYLQEEGVGANTDLKIDKPTAGYVCHTNCQGPFYTSTDLLQAIQGIYTSMV